VCVHLSGVHQLGGEHALPLERVEGVHVDPVCQSHCHGYDLLLRSKDEGTRRKKVWRETKMKRVAGGGRGRNTRKLKGR
jgi:hypothetical protein